MRILSIIAVSAALVAAPAFAAKTPKAPAKPAAAAPAAGQQKPPTEVEHAMLYLKVLISGLQSDKIEQPVKGALVGCLYNNSLGKITESTDKLIADNPGKVSRDNPNQVLSALVAVCGYKAEDAAASPTPAPAPRPTPPVDGR